MQNISDATRTALIDAVRSAARAEIVPRFRSLPPDSIKAKSAPDDLVTEADTRTELRLTNAIQEILPEAQILGEEAEAEDPSIMGRVAEPGLCAIIDPVDGTWNFASGLSIFGSILAVTNDGETVFGLLYDPLLDDWIMATRGGGAWYCRPGAAPQPISTAPATTLPEMTGFLGLHLFPKPHQAEIAQGFPNFRRILSLRCSCHEYRTLATGRVDFNMNGMLKPWDHAAGALVIEEAGGVAKMLDGRPYKPVITEGHMLTASCEETWQQVQTYMSARLPIPGI
ncbi:MAG: inositol monophosphatase family protein [Pseudomonadota bacterium]